MSIISRWAAGAFALISGLLLSIYEDELGKYGWWLWAAWIVAAVVWGAVEWLRRSTPRRRPPSPKPPPAPQIPSPPTTGIDSEGDDWTGPGFTIDGYDNAIKSKGSRWNVRNIKIRRDPPDDPVKPDHEDGD